MGPQISLFFCIQSEIAKFRNVTKNGNLIAFSYTVSHCLVLFLVTFLYLTAMPHSFSTVVRRVLGARASATGVHSLSNALLQEMIPAPGLMR